MKEFQTLRLKDLLSFCSGDTLSSEMLVDGGEFPVYGGNGVRGKYDRFNRDGIFILVGRVGARCGNIHKVSGKFWATEHALIGTTKRYFEIRWLYYVLINMDLGQYSIASAQPVLSISKINRLELNLPPIEEQRAIADYLDEKTVEIDKQISLLERQQKAYEKLKRSLISQVVTRGLNKDVPLKDSGIDWIGEIPANWEIKRIKAIFTECKELSTTGTEDLLSVSEYYGVARRLDVKEDDEYDTRADSLEGYKICKKNDLVINIMLAWKRGLGFSDFDGIVSPAYAVYRGKGIIPHYYHYLLRTDRYIAEFKRNSKGIIDSRLRLYSDRFFAVKTIVPPIEEQQAIADYLDEKTAEIDEQISNIDKKINTYKRLKQSLIDEVVTGKRKI